VASALITFAIIDPKGIAISSFGFAAKRVFVFQIKKVSFPDS